MATDAYESGIPYLKGHGTQNDFVLIPDPQACVTLTPALVAAICDRRAGVGADGVLRVVPSTAEPDAADMADEARWFMDYRNADGGMPEMCGNGIRVFARYLVEAGLVEPGPLRVATRGGVKHVTFASDGAVTADMGPATFPGPQDATVRVGERSWPAVTVSMGNPHAVVFVDDLAEAGPLYAMPAVGPESAFPDGVNVEFVVDRDLGHVAMRVHERGVGETRSCGTGACAVAAAAARRHGQQAPTAYTV
ncbi:MAG: diaminopimelate epimerase, partial [Actinomycetes bacterium]